MKKVLYTTLAIASLLLCACSSSSGSSSTDSTDGVTTNSDGTDGTTGSSDGATSADDGTSGTTHEVTTADGDMTFTPENLTISVGDTVRFVMSGTHNAIEVSKDTYDARGVTALDGGFQVNFGETQEVTFTEPGVHYYVCTPHVTIEMIGTITVE